MALQHAIQLEHACIPTYLYALYSIKPDQKQGDCRSPSLGHAGRNAAHRADGGTPAAGVIRDSTGNLYGTTTYGGVANEGVVYKLGTTGQEYQNRAPVVTGDSNPIAAARRARTTPAPEALSRSACQQGPPGVPFAIRSQLLIRTQVMRAIIIDTRAATRGRRDGQWR